jgi:hypothetical protein
MFLNGQGGVQMKSIGIVVALISVFAFSKFYLVPPSSAEGREVVSEYVQAHSGGNLQLADFRRTGGQEYMLGGARIYVMTFEGTIRCAGSDPSEESPAIEFVFDRTNNAGPLPYHSGESRTVRGAIQFEKTSYAWVGQPM